MNVTGFGKFDYAVELAMCFPCVDFDSNGTPYETPHHTCFLRDEEAEVAILETNLTGREEEFYKQEGIIPVIEAYGLDKEKFWYAVVYVASLTMMWSEQKAFFKQLPTALEQITRMRDEIRSQHEFKITIDNPTESHTIEMAGNRLMELLVESLDELIEKERHSRFVYSHEIPIWRSSVIAKKTEMTWYAANMFKLLFERLDLPVIRSRSAKKEFRTLASGFVQVKGSYAVTSYDKNQLIAELIHFLDLTDNPDLDGNSIRAILKSKRKFGLGFY